MRNEGRKDYDPEISPLGVRGSNPLGSGEEWSRRRLIYFLSKIALFPCYIYKKDIFYLVYIAYIKKLYHIDDYSLVQATGSLLYTVKPPFFNHIFNQCRAVVI